MLGINTKLLQSLTKSTKEDQQVDAFTKFLSRATADDLKYVSKIIDKDLKVFIGIVSEKLA